MVDVSPGLCELGLLSRKHRNESSIWFSSLIGPHSEVSQGDSLGQAYSGLSASVS